MTENPTYWHVSARALELGLPARALYEATVALVRSGEDFERALQLAGRALVAAAGTYDTYPPVVNTLADGGKLIDPDCRSGKCSACVGGPCEHECHRAGVGS